MSQWRKIIVRSMPAIFGLCIILFLGSSLSKSVYHQELTRYGVPICNIDRHRFDGDTCESCGNSVQKSGVFYSVDVAVENPYGLDYERSFKDYYESWDAFKLDYDSCLSSSVVIFVVVLCELCTYVFLFIYSRRGSKAPRLGGRVK